MSEMCLRYSKIWFKYQDDEKRVHLGRLRCKQWSCDYCARENARMWRSFLNQRLPEVGQDWYLLTFTARADTRGRIESYKQLSRALDVALKRFRRAFGKVEYVRVFEKHPTSDALHAHLIVFGLKDFVKVERSQNGRDKYTATNFRRGKRGFWALRTFTKKTAQASGAGYIADAKHIGAAQPATHYVTDYMTKDLQAIDIRGLRHVQTSRAIGSPKPKRDRNKFIHIANGLQSAFVPDGWAVLDRDTGEVIGGEYWIENKVYPHPDERHYG